MNYLKVKSFNAEATEVRVSEVAITSIADAGSYCIIGTQGGIYKFEGDFPSLQNILSITDLN